ncbi:MAG: 30S ribosomal protein S5 [Candidatus Dojkabacteria bacterium]|jgi:small subunit ribosomal protein S5
MFDNRRNQKERSPFDKKTVSIRRVAKVTKGGKRLRFSAMVVVGDHNGSVGVGLGRGIDTRSAVEKGERVAIKKMKKIQLAGDTIPHEVLHKEGAAKVLLRPARTGTGVIAGSSVRTVLELAGIDNVYGKLLGTTDSIASAYATFEALKSLRNTRVLSKMKYMRDRVEAKKETDKENKIKDEKRKAAKRIEKRGEKKDFRGRDRRSNSNRREKK